MQHPHPSRAARGCSPPGSPSVRPHRTAAGGSPSAAAPVPSDDTLTIATTTDVVNFNPLLGNSRTDSWITNLMYPHLLTISDDGTKEPTSPPTWGYVDDTDRVLRDPRRPDLERRRAADRRGRGLDHERGQDEDPKGGISSASSPTSSRPPPSPTPASSLTLTQPDSSIIEEIGFWVNVVPEHVFEQSSTIADFANDARLGRRRPVRARLVARSARATRWSASTTTRWSDGKPDPGRGRLPRVPRCEHRDPRPAERRGRRDRERPAAGAGRAAEDHRRASRSIEVAGLGYAHMVYNMEPSPTSRRPRCARRSPTRSTTTPIRTVGLQGQAVSTGSSPLMPVSLKYYDEPGSRSTTSTREVARAQWIAGYTATPRQLPARSG